MTPTLPTLGRLRRLVPPRALTYGEAYTIAERQALTLVDLAGIDTPAIPSELIIGQRRLDVTYDHGLPASGLSVWKDGRWIITINANDTHERQRFTLAHEFKHILDHPFIDRIYGDPRTPRTREMTERVCDYFAACLLMPRPLLKREFTTGTQSVAELAATFDVSRAAMLVRLRQTGMLDTPTRHGSAYHRAKPLPQRAAA